GGTGSQQTILHEEQWKMPALPALLLSIYVVVLLLTMAPLSFSQANTLSAVRMAAILDDQSVCGRGERLALALARENINSLMQDSQARVEVDVYELQKDSQYDTTDTMCQILPKGVVSVIGPASSPASGSTISHICGEKEVSHIWLHNMKSHSDILSSQFYLHHALKLPYLRFASVTLYPSNEDLSLAIGSILRSFGYPTASLVCAKAECLLRLEELVHRFLISRETLSVRMLDDSLDPTPLLKEIRDDKVATIIIDANASISYHILRKVRRQSLRMCAYVFFFSSSSSSPRVTCSEANELGMTSAFYKYILTTMTFNGAVRKGTSLQRPAAFANQGRSRRPSRSLDRDQNRSVAVSFWDAVAVFPPPAVLLASSLRLLQPTALCHGWQPHSLTVYLAVAVAEIDLATGNRTSNNNENNGSSFPTDGVKMNSNDSDDRPTFMRLQQQDFPLLRLDDVVEDHSNIVGFSMLNSSHPFYLEFIRSLNLSWREGCDISPYPGPALSSALMFDAVHVVVSAVRRAGAEPQSGDRREAAELHLPAHLAARHEPHELPTHATRDLSSPVSLSLSLCLQSFWNVEYDGLTGHIEFNSKGQRTNYTLKILEKHPGGHKEIGTWYSNNTLAMNSTSLDLNASETLANKTLIVTTILPLSLQQENPYVMRKSNYQDFQGNNQYEGFCVDMLRELADILKFSFKIKLVDDGLYGAPEPNGSWTGMVGELINRKADLAVAGFTITSEREKVIDFSKPFMTLGISILYRVHLGRKPGLLLLPGSVLASCLALHVVGLTSPSAASSSSPPGSAPMSGIILIHVCMGAAGRPGEPVHAGEQSVVPGGRLHAAGLGDHAPGSVHPLRQRSLVRIWGGLI
ncbi:hypothetical protein L3Q82_015369, partial [Scortum barcoo]